MTKSPKVSPKHAALLAQLRPFIEEANQRGPLSSQEVERLMADAQVVWGLWKEKGEIGVYLIKGLAFLHNAVTTGTATNARPLVLNCSSPEEAFAISRAFGDQRNRP